MGLHSTHSKQRKCTVGPPHSAQDTTGALVLSTLAAALFVVISNATSRGPGVPEALLPTHS